MRQPNFEEIAGAVARGWCAPENERKEMDADLAYAVTREIEALLPRRGTLLLLRRPSRWNAWVRDWTARLERLKKEEQQ